MADEPQGQGGGAAPTPQTPPVTERPKRGKTEYLVYEATRLGAGERADELTLLGKFKGEEEKDARWAAVDATDGLAERVGDEEQRNPVHLLAIPLSRAMPKVTREEVEVKKVRR